MVDETTSQAEPRSAKLLKTLAVLGLVVLILALCVPMCRSAILWYSEWNGPHRSITDVADLDGDGDLDVIVGHTRWEAMDISWAGIILWINQGGGQFARNHQELPGGFSAVAADVDGDEDADLLILDGYELMLCLNQGGLQGGKLGVFKTRGSIGPSNQWRGHADMGGSVILGDLNNDGALDGFVAGCCYGTGEDPFVDSSHLPSIAWVWIYERDSKGRLVDHTLSLSELDGLPMRAVALGDLDGDGDLDAFAAVGAPTIGESDSLDDLILLNDGSGNFTASDQWQGSSDSAAVALGDVDGDGDLDALVGTKNGAILWINQSGAPGGQEAMFAPSEQKLSRGQIKAVFLYDLDDDGDQDALIAGLRQAVIWWNDGQAGFAQSSQRFRYYEPDGLAIGDFDGDGAPDIFAGAIYEAYAVWSNQGDGTFREGGWH
jgi:hypothetical protein